MVNSHDTISSLQPPSASGASPYTYAGAHLLPRLRCYFAEFLNQRSLTRLRILSSPTCVGLRYGRRTSSLEAFLGGLGSTTWGELPPLRHHLSVFRENGFAYSLHLQAYTGTTSARMAYPSASPLRSNAFRRYGNINPFPIDYAFRPRLRSRLTLGRRPLPRKP